jgi:hypothetical protein
VLCTATTAAGYSRLLSKEKRPAPKVRHRTDSSRGEHSRTRVPPTSHRSRGSPRPSLSRSVEENLHRPSLIAECRKFGVGVWCFDRPADKATRSLLCAIALRQRRDVSHSKSTSCEMRTRRAFCFVPENRGTFRVPVYRSLGAGRRTCPRVAFGCLMCALNLFEMR